MMNALYRAKDLEDLAKLFDQNEITALAQEKRAKLKQEKLFHKGEAVAWRQAAEILRNSTIEGLQP